MTSSVLPWPIVGDERRMKYTKVKAECCATCHFHFDFTELSPETRLQLPDESVYDHLVEESPLGGCRRHPPTFADVAGPVDRDSGATLMGRFPSTIGFDWCGEYRRRADLSDHRQRDGGMKVVRLGRAVADEVDASRLTGLGGADAEVAGGGLPLSFVDAEERCVTPLDVNRGRVGVAFTLADGSVVRLALQPDCVASLCNELAAYSSSRAGNQSPMSPLNPSDAKLVPSGGENV